ncbi:uncharacterized protein BDV14DRAFT_199888 [Aspergillus stella-maris]|uniref:uncharacterized protein n=1 Tax=Aspergillus stella-maris TaxID=1810926 RepID=UPI003CCD5B25
MEFPIISLKDLNSDFENISKAILKASQEWGFFIVTHHGVTGSDRIFELSRQFFDLPMEVKGEKTLNELGVGYDGHKPTSFAASEGMALGLPVGQLSGCPNLHSWWDSFKIAEIESFKTQCHALTLRILACYAEHFGLPRNFFESSHNNTLPGNALKFMKYPKIETKPSNSPARLSEHSDWGSLTLLFMGSPGLEVRDPSDNWHDISHIDGGIVVNIGDLLSFWSDGKLKSTMHRISWDKVPLDSDRFSIPYFAQPSFETDLKPLTGSTDAKEEAKPLTYSDYYHARIRLTWGAVLDDGKKQSEVPERLGRYLG